MSLHTIRQFTFRLAAVLLALMATPAMAQVDWDALVNGKWGPDTCPSGHSENRANLFKNGGVGVVTADTVTVNAAELTLQTLRSALGNPLATSVNVLFNLYKNGTANAKFKNLGVATADTSIAASSFTFSGLESGTRYTAIFHAPSVSNLPFATACFRTGYAAADMNRKPDGNDLGRDPLGTSGCFAIGGERLGGGDAAIRACFCGARNRNGEWARTGTVEPGTNLTDDSTYKWIMSSTERMNQGCTTN